MATRCLINRSLFSKQSLISAVSRCSYTTSAAVPNSSFLLRRLRPLVAASTHYLRFSPVRTFASRQTASSLNDPNPNWTNRPPKETILLDGCDFEHWLVVMEKPEGDPTRDEIIDSYIKTLTMVVGSEEEARMKIYSVSTRHYFAFGALVSEELSYKLKELPRVRWVLPDSYLDVKNKDYGGEPFINGQAVPYDPKYHEEWVRNNARANERNRRNDRPRNFDRSRNFERRREMQQTGNQNTGGNFGGQFGNTASAPNASGPPPNASNPGAMQPNMGTQPNYRGAPPNNPGNYGMPNNAPNYGPNSGQMPYQSGSGPNPSGFGPNMGHAQGQQPNPSGFASNMGPAQVQQPNPSGFASNMGTGQGQQPNPSGFPPNMGPGQGQQANPSGFAPPHMGPGQGQQANPSGFAQSHMGPGQGQQQGGYAPNSSGFSYQNQNVPNRGYTGGQSQSSYVPNAVSGSGPNQNTYNPNNGYVPNAGAGNSYQNQNLPGRDY